MPKVIGLVGRRGSGKDSIGQILVGQYGFTRVAFADKVKEVCKVVFELTDEEMNDRVLKETPLDRWPYETPRSLMQRVGTECFRTYWPDVWIEAAKREIDKHEKVVITDVRFENELLVSRCRAGVNVRVDASGRLGPLTDSHQSEALTELLPVQHVIDNNGAPEVLPLLVQELMEVIDG